MSTALQRWSFAHYLMQDSHGQKLDMRQFVVGGNWCQYLATLKNNRAWGDHIAVVALATALSYDIRIVSSASGTSDCFDVIVEPNNNKASHDKPLLLGHYAEHHYESLDIVDNGIKIP